MIIDTSSFRILLIDLDIRGYCSEFSHADGLIILIRLFIIGITLHAGCRIADD